MSRVKGIGAVMIYADDPAALSRWYARVLGIETSFNEKDGWYNGDVGGAIHFGIHAAEDKTGAGVHTMMINYEVDDLEEFLKHLARHEVKLTHRLEEDYGSFAYFYDPEGNPIEVWARRAD